MKQMMKEAVERMEELLKTSEHEMYLEINQVRSQVCECLLVRMLLRNFLCSMSIHTSGSEPC